MHVFIQHGLKPNDKIWLERKINHKNKFFFYFLRATLPFENRVTLIFVISMPKKHMMQLNQTFALSLNPDTLKHMSIQVCYFSYSFIFLWKSPIVLFYFNCFLAGNLRKILTNNPNYLRSLVRQKDNLLKQQSSIYYKDVTIIFGNMKGVQNLTTINKLLLKEAETIL